jgi:Icc-related predicted phosphoesterase
MSISETPSVAPLRIAALSDLHYGRNGAGAHRDLLRAATEAGDVLVLCGDLTDYGLPEEAELLAADLHAGGPIPVIAVLGNHDWESGRQQEVRDVLEKAGVRVLDGTCEVVDGVGFAGVRGFAGGFGRWALSAWGEAPIKEFVQEAVDESLRLDAALGRLQAEHRVSALVAVMHYAPIRETVVGEPEEIFAFMGSSRLEEPLNRHAVAAALHGHAHAGAPEGRTTTGRPVYNVSLQVLRRAFPDQPPFRLIEVPRGGEWTPPIVEGGPPVAHAVSTNGH